MNGRAMPLDTTAATASETSPWPLSRLTREMLGLRDEAWAEFHRLYFHRLYAYALKLHHGDHASAEDSVQSGFLRAVRNIRRFDDEDTFWSWLTLLVRCAAADQGRRFSAYSRMLETLANHPDGRRRHDSAFASSTSILLEEALNHIGGDDRKLLEEKYATGHSTAELAKARDTTDKAIECRLRRLRKKLKSKINELAKRTSA